MALILRTLKAAGSTKGCSLGFMRWAHITAMSPPLDGSFHSSIKPPQMILPKFDRSLDERSDIYSNHSEFGFPSFAFHGSMELMAVPKKKVSPHKRGIRNGPKALKPTPVIIRCRSCGRVKLPHFYCCSGDRGKTGEQNN